jgi:hypothetical protein
MSTDATVDIIDVVLGAIKVYADTLIKGDKVFDYHGGTHEIGKPRLSARHVTTRRADGWVDTWGHDDIVTILPNGEVGREIDFASSGSRQGYIETGRYSTVAEEQEINA